MMKKTLFLLIVAFISNFSFGLYAVKAEEDSATQLEKRISIYEKDYPVILTPEESQLLLDNCVLMQQKLAKARDSIDETIVSRESSYGYIERRLSSIQSRLSGQGIDTSIIDLMLANYRVEVNNFKNSATLYRTTVNDAIRIDCVNRPKSFKSAILAARSDRLLTVKSMKSIRELYTSSITDGFKLLESQIYGK